MNFFKRLFYRAERDLRQAFKDHAAKIYYKAYPERIGEHEEIIALSRDNLDLKANIKAYERQEFLTEKLKPVQYEAIEFVPTQMIPTDTAEKNFEKCLRDNFARKLEPEIAKKFIIKKDIALSNQISTAYRAYIKFYEEA